MDTNDFLYFIDKINNIIYFNPIITWSNEKCLADHYSEDENNIITEIAEKLNLVEAVESGYMPVHDLKISKLEPIILQLGFIKNKDFYKYMSECS